MWQPTISHLTRSTLHRCLAQGAARAAAAPTRGQVRAYPIGYFHVDIAEVHTEEGRLYLFVAVDRTSKLAFARLHERATRRVAAEFLEALAAAVPYRIHTVLTDNGTQFVDNSPITAWQLEREAAALPDSAAPGVACEPTRPPLYRRHAFDAACERLGVEHRLPRPRCRGGAAGPDPMRSFALRAWRHRSGPRTTTPSGPRSTASSQHATSCSRARGRPSRRS